MARFVYKLPDIGEGISEAEIVGWHVKVGDVVEDDDRIADMMTDKATVEMESPVSGTILELAGEVGDVVAIGAALVVIETDDVPDEATEGGAEVLAVHSRRMDEEREARERTVVEAADPEGPMDEAELAAETPGVGNESSSAVTTPSSSAITPASSSPVTPAKAGVHAAKPAVVGDRQTTLRGDDGAGAAARAPVLASPAVRKRAADLQIDLADVKAAEGGRVRHGDLDAFLTYNAHRGYGAQAPRADEQVRVIGLRRRIAENMAASKRAIPHFTYVEEIDMTKAEALRADLNATRGDRPKLTVLPIIITAVCQALPDFPMINARYDGEAGVVSRSGAVHLGIATQTDAGLMVPVVRGAEGRNVWQLATEIARLADAARSGKATSAELSGGTLTVTSLGPLGGIATTPVINRPEVAIIGPNNIVERPVIRDGEIVAAKLMNLSISCDHRVVDGWDAASFVQRVKGLLETPVLLFAD